jgi:uncharacterized membrane protein
VFGKTTLSLPVQQPLTKAKEHFLSVAMAMMSSAVIAALCGALCLQMRIMKQSPKTRINLFTGCVLVAMAGVQLLKAPASMYNIQSKMKMREKERAATMNHWKEIVHQYQSTRAPR